MPWKPAVAVMTLLPAPIDGATNREEGPSWPEFSEKLVPSACKIHYDS